MADAREVIATWLLENYGSYDVGDSDGLLSALAAAGLKVVSREPTEAMSKKAEKLVNGRACNMHWRTMFDAAPPQPKESASE